MKVVALVPFWEKYENNEFRLKKISGRYLISYVLQRLNSISLIDDTYIYASSNSVLNYIENHLKFNFLPRPEYLDSPVVSIENIISEFLKVVKADIVLLVHPTSPFLKPHSILKALDLLTKKNIDSVFTAVKYKKFCWLNGAPINFNLTSNVPHLRNLDPIYLEQASLYAFKVKSFLDYGHRAGGTVKMVEINQLEGLEIRSIDDFKLAELIINSGMSLEI